MEPLSGSAIHADGLLMPEQMSEEMDTQWPDGLERVVRTEAEEAERQEEVQRFIRDFQRMMESVEENGG